MTAIGRSTHTTKWIPVSDISVVWVTAQRPFDKKWAQYIADNLDPDMFGVISVASADKNGTYHAIDGQHRAAAVRMAWGENEKVPCNIFDADTPEHAAAIFDAMNTKRKKPHVLDIFKVRVTAKIEPEHSVSKLVTELGYVVTSGSDDKALAAVGACVSVWKRQGEARLRNTLLVIQGTWGFDHHAVNGYLIRGYAEFLGQYDVDKQRLVSQVSKGFTPGKLLGAAKNARELFGGNLGTSVSKVLLATYNKGLKSGRLEE